MLAMLHTKLQLSSTTTAQLQQAGHLPEWILATPLTCAEAMTARYAMRTCRVASQERWH